MATSGSSPITIPTARAGLDRLVLSLHPADPHRFHRQLTAQAPSLPGYQPAAGPYAAEGLYRQLYQYAPISRRRPYLDLLCAPEHHGLPAGQIALRASITHLITSCPMIDAVLAPLTACLAATTSVSLAELSIDFPMTATVHATVCREAYAPWTRATGWYLSTYYLTTACSLVCSRIYPKEEDGIAVERIELVLRRRFFHRHGVTSVADLARGGWLDAAQRSLRFVRYRPTSRRSAVENDQIQQLITARGVNKALRRYSGDAQRIRRRLEPTDTDDRARAALARLRRELPR